MHACTHTRTRTHAHTHTHTHAHTHIPVCGLSPRHASQPTVMHMAFFFFCLLVFAVRKPFSGLYSKYNKHIQLIIWFCYCYCGKIPSFLQLFKAGVLHLVRFRTTVTLPYELTGHRVLNEADILTFHDILLNMPLTFCCKQAVHVIYYFSWTNLFVLIMHLK
jgi:hypothetical protein